MHRCTGSHMCSMGLRSVEWLQVHANSPTLHSILRNGNISYTGRPSGHGSPPVDSRVIGIAGSTSVVVVMNY